MEQKISKINPKKWVKCIEVNPKVAHTYFSLGGDDGLVANEKLFIFPGKSIIVRDNNMGQRYYHFRDIMAFIDVLMGHDGAYDLHEVGLCEYFDYMDFPQRPKFDFDKKGQHGEREEKMFDHAIDLIGSLMNDYGISPEFVVCDSSDDGKFSRHVTIKNCIFHDWKDSVAFTDNLHRLFSETYGDKGDAGFIDRGVNDKNKSLRIAGSIKEHRVKRICSDFLFVDTLFTVFPENLERVPRIMSIDPVESYRTAKMIGTDFSAKSETKSRVISTSTRAMTVEEAIPKAPADLKKKVAAFVEDKFNITGAKTSEKCITIDLQIKNPSTCKCCDRIHEKDNAYIVCFDDAAYYGCHRFNADHAAELAANVKLEKRLFLIWKRQKLTKKKAADEQFDDEEAIDGDPRLKLVIEKARKDMMGLSELYSELYGNDTINARISKDDTELYVFDEKTKIWVHPMHSTFTKMIWTRLRPELSYAIDSPHVGDATMKVLKAVLSKIDGGKQLSTIAEHACGPENSTFVKVKNSISHLLPTNDGNVINLKTGKVEPRTREHSFTFECPWKYVEEIDPRVIKFVTDLMNDDKDLVESLQVAMGYCLTGDNPEKAMFILYNESGNNGKSAFMNIMADILADYATTVPHSVLIATEKESSKEAHTAHLNPIVGRRVIKISELRDGAQLDVEMCKQLTGADPIAMRKLRHEYENDQYRAKCKPIIITNHLPTFNADDAIIRRVNYFPFNAIFSMNPTGTEKKADPSLVEKLSIGGELIDHIASWLVQGAVKYYKNGLKFSSKIYAEKAKCIDNLDVAGKFINATCDINEEMITKKIIDYSSEYKCLASELFNSYVEWCKSTGRPAGTQRAFGMSLKSRLPSETKRHAYYFGIKLKTAPIETINTVIGPKTPETGALHFNI